MQDGQPTPEAGGETQLQLSRTVAEGSKPDDTLSSDFQPPRQWDNKLLLLEPLVCSTLLQWPQETNTLSSSGPQSPHL